MNPHVDFEGTVMQATLAAQRALEQAGLQVLRSFDLAVAGSEKCACQDHGTRRCTCQYTVLLVYPASGPPAAVASHALGGRARLEVVLDPNAAADAGLVKRILGALASAAGEAPEVGDPF